MPVALKIEVKGLKQGDYSIEGLEDRIAIERKSCEDLIGTVARGRDRFVRELERLSELDFACVLIESEWKHVLKHCHILTDFNPASLDASILAWMQRYPVHWVWRPSRFTAAKTAYKIFDRFWRDHSE